MDIDIYRSIEMRLFLNTVQALCLKQQASEK